MMKGTHQNYGFSSDFSSEFPQHLPQIYDSQQQSSPVGLFNPPPSSSSSRENGSQQQKIWPSNSSSTMISTIVSPSSAFYATEVYTNLPQYNFQENIGLSESEQLLYLKNKLLGDLDDDNQNLGVSENLYASHFDNINQFGRQPSNNCGSVSSSKTRIRWTQELHDRFVECVNRLGGPEKATPKAILKLMCAEGLTILQVKSHLQKYRQVKYVPESVEGRSEKKNSTHNVAQFDIETGMQIKEALQLQLDVQRRLHEQLEIQKKLQLRIEQEAKRLKVMIDQQQKTTRNLSHSNSKGPDAHEEDSEVFVSEGSDDDDDIVLSST